MNTHSAEYKEGYNKGYALEPWSNPYAHLLEAQFHTPEEDIDKYEDFTEGYHEGKRARIKADKAKEGAHQ